MATEITLKMDGTLLNWLKEVGQPVNSGDVIAEIEADKATVEIEAPAAGVLAEVRAKPGEELREGTVIAVISESVSAAPAAQPAAKKPDAQTAPAPAAGNGAQQAAASDDDGRIKASPLARRLAQEKGLDLRQMSGSGPGGRIVKADVEGFTPSAAPAASEAAPAPAPASSLPAAPARKAPEGPDVEHIELTTLRQRIVAVTVESKQWTPHFYVTTEIDVADLLRLRKLLNENLPEDAVKISVNDMLVKAAALTLRQFPNLNTHFYGDRLVRHKRINIGIAVALPQGGLMYVVAHDADQTALGTLAAENKAKIQRAREGKVKPDDISGATFSTSNLGPYSTEHFSAIINPPEAGILAIGATRKVPVVLPDGSLGVGERMKVTISVDHRVSDGAEGALYLQAFKDLIEHPLRLLL
ncbi:MAG: dihydrolipoamide acetyltransferase family protein [Aggregatilineales bacterium]